MAQRRFELSTLDQEDSGSNHGKTNLRNELSGIGSSLCALGSARSYFHCSGVYYTAFFLVWYSKTLHYIWHFIHIILVPRTPINSKVPSGG